MDNECAAPGVSRFADKVGQEFIRIVVVDADAGFDRDRCVGYVQSIIGATLRVRSGWAGSLRLCCSCIASVMPVLLINALVSLLAINITMFSGIASKTAVFLLAVGGFAPVAMAGTDSGNVTGENSGRELPRFVSLRSDEVNVRTGPGLRYPIEWVFQRADLPVEVISEFEAWRKIRDHEGNEGWVHRALLSAQRNVIIEGDIRLMRRKANDESRPVARLEPGVIARLDGCEDGWCEIAVAGYNGWIEADLLWGVYVYEYDAR